MHFCMRLSSLLGLVICYWSYDLAFLLAIYCLLLP